VFSYIIEIMKNEEHASMEDLNKSQIVLLVLFVSFITSIATGIVTVTLLDQAPEGVTQTINRVVERTIETVVPAETQKTTVVTNEVVIKEEDLVVEAIAKNIGSVVRIQRVIGEEKVPLGIGFIATESGIMVADADSLFGENIFAEYRGKTYPLEILSTEGGLGITTLDLGAMASTTLIPNFKTVSFIDAHSVKLGQTAISLGGQTGKEIQRGIISGIETKELISENKEGEEITNTVLDYFKTNIIFANGSSGGPLITLGGNVAGMNLRTSTGWITVPSSAITNAIAAATGIAEGDEEPEPEPEVSGIKKITDVFSNITGGDE